MPPFDNDVPPDETTVPPLVAFELPMVLLVLLFANEAEAALVFMRRASEVTSPYSAEVADDRERGIRWQGQVNLDEEECAEEVED